MKPPPCPGFSRLGERVQEVLKRTASEVLSPEEGRDQKEGRDTGRGAESSPTGEVMVDGSFLFPACLFPEFSTRNYYILFVIGEGRWQSLNTRTKTKPPTAHLGHTPTHSGPTGIGLQRTYLSFCFEGTPRGRHVFQLSVTH